MLEVVDKEISFGPILTIGPYFWCRLWTCGVRVPVRPISEMYSDVIFANGGPGTDRKGDVNTPDPICRSQLLNLREKKGRPQREIRGI